MKLPLQINFKNCPQSAAVVEDIREKAAQLERYYPRIMGCRIVVEAPHHHQRKGNLYRILVDMTLPGKEIVVGRSPSLHAAHKDVFVAIRDSFKAARRQLQDRVRLLRGEVRQQQAGLSTGRIMRLSEEGYGFILTPDGREIYFYQNSVIGNTFYQLKKGKPVRFCEEIGEQGPQATTVYPVGRF